MTFWFTLVKHFTHTLLVTKAFFRISLFSFISSFFLSASILFFPVLSSEALSCLPLFLFLFPLFQVIIIRDDSCLGNKSSSLSGCANIICNSQNVMQMFGINSADTSGLSFGSGPELGEFPHVGQGERESCELLELEESEEHDGDPKLLSV